MFLLAFVKNNINDITLIMPGGKDAELDNALELMSLYKR